MQLAGRGHATWRGEGMQLAGRGHATPHMLVEMAKCCQINPSVLQFNCFYSVKVTYPLSTDYTPQQASLHWLAIAT